MRLGEVRSESSVANSAVDAEFGVYTDQWMVECQRIYLDYLRNKTPTEVSYINNHRALTFDRVTIKAVSSSIFFNIYKFHCAREGNLTVF